MASRVENNIIFQAHYPKYFEPSTFENVAKVAYNIFSVFFFPLGIYRLASHAIHVLSGLMIVQSQQVFNKDYKDPVIRKAKIEHIKEFCKEDFKEIKEVNLKTPDGRNLNGMVFKSKTDTPQGTIIFFGGMAYFYEDVDIDIYNCDPRSFVYDHSLDQSLLAKAAQNGFNVILYNPAGTGLSNERATKDKLQLDGETLLQYAQQELHTKVEDTVVYGHSLGGYSATKLAANHPEVKLVSDRSFSTLCCAIEHAMPLIIGKILAVVTWFFGWNMDSFNEWKKVKGHKAIVFGEHDTCVVYEASLKKRCEKSKENFFLLSKKSNHMEGLTTNEFNSLFTYLLPNFKPVPPPAWVDPNKSSWKKAASFFLFQRFFE
ncbi:MAG: alpha/beta hydrolase [Chlamydiae bacterium]|nr:alpha/beta hydrolase [Chlamydiota bacterium]